MNCRSLKITHKKINLNNQYIDSINIYERNSNFSWFCSILDNTDQYDQKNYVQNALFKTNYKIIKKPSGRPILLRNSKKDVSISISHKENVYIIARSLKKRHSIGVDIETYNPAKDYSFIARTLLPSEYLVLTEIQKKFSIDLNKSYLCIWTIKECLVKILDKKADWQDIEVKLSKYGHFQFYIKNIKLNGSQLKIYFYNNIIISVVYL